MLRKSTLPPDAPVWLTEDHRIDEMTFCCSVLEAHPMKCVHGKLYTVDGLISDEAALKREIFMEICDWVKSPGIWTVISVKKRNTAGTGWRSHTTRRQA